MRGFLFSLLGYTVAITALLILGAVYSALHPLPHWGSEAMTAMEANSAASLASSGSGCRIDQPTFGDLNKLDLPVVKWC